MFNKRVCLFLSFILVVVVSGCKLNNLYEYRNIDVDDISEEYSISEVIFEQNGQSHLENLYSFEHISKEIIGTQSILIYGRNNFNEYIIIIYTDAAKDLVYSKISPFPSYEIIVEQIELFNQNSTSKEGLIHGADGDITFLSNDIVDYEYENYFRIASLSYMLFGDTDSYNGEEKNDIDNSLIQLKLMLSYGLIMEVGAYVDEYGQKSTTYLGVSVDGGYTVFSCRGDGDMLREIFTFGDTQ